MREKGSEARGERRLGRAGRPARPASWLLLNSDHKAPSQHEAHGHPATGDHRSRRPCSLPGSERPQAPTTGLQFPQGPRGKAASKSGSKTPSLGRAGDTQPGPNSSAAASVPVPVMDRGTPASPLVSAVDPASSWPHLEPLLYQGVFTRPLHPSLHPLKRKPPGHPAVAPGALPHPLFPCGFLGAEGSWGHLLSPRGER